MKRITKKEAYAMQGIELVKVGTTNKIVTPLGLMCELLKKGNSKTGKRVLTWSMNQTTCVYHCKDCYANFGCYHFPSVKESLRKNTELATKYRAFWKACIIAQLSTLKDGTEIRIHAVGDFLSREYVNDWCEIIAMFPNLIFWTYTKTEYVNAFDKFDNANIVKSLIGDKFNFGHCDHVMNLYRELKAKAESVYICRCGIDDTQHCEGCHKCSSHEYVLFLEHSTDYDAKADALYNELKTMIDNQ